MGPGLGLHCHLTGLLPPKRAAADREVSKKDKSPLMDLRKGKREKKKKSCTAA